MLKLAGMLTVIVAVITLAPLAASADHHGWRNSLEYSPVFVDQDWNNPQNWWISGNGFGVPAAGDTLRIELRPGDTATLNGMGGWIIMNTDYSGGALSWAQIMAANPEVTRLSIQNYFKLSDANQGLRIWYRSHVRVEPTGTINGNVSNAGHSSLDGQYAQYGILEFAGGNMVAGDLVYYENPPQTYFRVSSAAGSITPGAIETTVAPSDSSRSIFEFALAAAGVAPITLTAADPLQFTGTAAGTNPFKLIVNMTAYTGPAVSIPLFIFSASSTETDRMFDPVNITISNQPGGGSPWTVVQTDTGVTLTPMVPPGTVLLVK